MEAFKASWAGARSLESLHGMVPEDECSGEDTLLREPQACCHATAAAAYALPMKALEDRENIRAFSLHQALNLAHGCVCSLMRNRGPG